MLKVMDIHWADYVMLSVVLLISLLIGLVCAILQRKSINSKAIVNGTKSFGAFPVAMSLLASYISAISLLGNPAEIYMNGTMYFYQVLSMVFVMLICSFFYIPVLYSSGVETAFEYIGKRFDRKEQILCSIIYIIQTIVYMGIVLYAPCLAINQVVGLSLWGIVCVVGIVCTLYTAFGGIKAVLWTDVFQTIVMCGCILMILIKGSLDFGNFDIIWNLNKAGGRIVFDNFSFDPRTMYSFWSVMVGGTVFWVSLFGVSPAMVQRMLSCKSQKNAVVSYVTSGVGFQYVLIATYLGGVVLYAEFGECNPVHLKGGIDATDQLMPYYVAKKFFDWPGVLGTFIAGISAAAMSTISSGTNSLVIVIMNDLCDSWVRHWSERRKLWFSKAIGLVIGILTILFAYTSSFMGPVIKAAISLFGMLSGPMLGVFTAGMCFPFANSMGAFIGHIISTALVLFIGLGKYFYEYPAKAKIDPTTCFKNDTSLNLINSPYPTHNFQGIENLFQVGFLMHGVIGSFSAFVLVTIISLLTKGNRKTPVNTKYLHKWFRKQCPDQQTTEETAM